MFAGEIRRPTATNCGVLDNLKQPDYGWPASAGGVTDRAGSRSGEAPAARACCRSSFRCSRLAALSCFFWARACSFWRFWKVVRDREAKTSSLHFLSPPEPAGRRVPGRCLGPNAGRQKGRELVSHLVEAAGVEPASGKAPGRKTTCLVALNRVGRRIEADQTTPP